MDANPKPAVIHSNLRVLASSAFMLLKSSFHHKNLNRLSLSSITS
jgi:hypothetical protein